MFSTEAAAPAVGHMFVVSCWFLNHAQRCSRQRINYGGVERQQGALQNPGQQEEETRTRDVGDDLVLARVLQFETK